MRDPRLMLTGEVYSPQLMLLPPLSSKDDLDVAESFGCSA